MRRGLLLAAVIFGGSHAGAQDVAPGARVLEAVTVHGASRLAALAYVGFLSATPLLVETGDMASMQAPVELALHHVTVAVAVREITKGLLKVSVRNAGPLLVVSVAPANDSLLTRRLGTFTFEGGDYVALDFQLSSAMRSASGCALMGSAWAGPAPPANFGRFSLANPTVQDVIEAATAHHAPDIWIFKTEARAPGCISDLSHVWEFGVYGFGSLEYGIRGARCQSPLLALSGPEYIPYDPRWHAFPEPCGSTSPPVF